MRRFSRLLCSLLISVLSVAGAEDILVQGSISPLNNEPTFNHGYLAVYEEKGMSVYAPSGSLAMKISSPDGAHIVNADIDVDGSVAVVTDGMRPRLGAILLFHPDGSPGGRIETGWLEPSQVCFAPDHSIWTLGMESRVPMSEHTDYFLLKHYSRDGQVLGRYFPRSSFAPSPGAGPGGLNEGGWQLRIANGRIGVLLVAVGENERPLWLETDLTGKETGRWTVTSDGGPGAMTDSGTVYFQGTGISTLDRASGKWKESPKSPDTILLGAEGDTLVFGVRGTNRLHRAMFP